MGDIFPPDLECLVLRVSGPDAAETSPVTGKRRQQCFVLLSLSQVGLQFDHLIHISVYTFNDGPPKVLLACRRYKEPPSEIELCAAARIEEPAVIDYMQTLSFDATTLRRVSCRCKKRGEP